MAIYSQAPTKSIGIFNPYDVVFAILSRMV